MSDKFPLNIFKYYDINLEMFPQFQTINLTKIFLQNFNSNF